MDGRALYLNCYFNICGIGCHCHGTVPLLKMCSYKAAPQALSTTDTAFPLFIFIFSLPTTANVGPRNPNSEKKMLFYKISLLGTLCYLKLILRTFCLLYLKFAEVHFLRFQPHSPTEALLQLSAVILPSKRPQKPAIRPYRNFIINRTCKNAFHPAPHFRYRPINRWPPS